jgi:hypothetical protein
MDVVHEVTWAGKAHCKVRPHLADDEAGWPVRILKDAIADGVPYKDMLITAEHCLFFENHFVPVRMLVNGRSIFYDKSIFSYDYYHVETKSHSVITADGMLTESYLDTGNRRAFQQNGKVVAFAPSRELSWADDAAAALGISREFVEPLFHRIDARAEQVGIVRQTHTPELTDDAGLHVTTDSGMIIYPARMDNDRITFLIPTGVKKVRVVSQASRPSDTIGPFVDDRRQLGVLVGEITLFESNRTSSITAHMTQDDLSGWHAIETSSCRWTDGSAELPLGTRHPNSVALLAIQIKAAGPYLVNAPADTSVAAIA